MQRKPNPRALAAAFLAVSAALTGVVLALRNLYDDEISSLNLIAGPVANILGATRQGDVHPPGMYLLAHLAYSIVPSFRWMDLFPSLFVYAGLAIFLFQVTPLFTRTRAQVCLLLLATLHPQLLLWNSTFRWYSWWTGIALIAITVALQPRVAEPRLSACRGLVLGLLLASLFYLGYITFLFAVALAPAMLLRYRSQPWRRLLTPVLLALVVFCALIAPRIPTLIAVQLPNNGQRAGLADSFSRLLQSIAASEAYLPWHPLAILADLLFAALSIAGLAALLRLRRTQSLSASLRARLQPCHATQGEQPALAPEAKQPYARPSNALASITLFGLFFFLLVAATGLGGKPRNGLLLVPVLAPAAALIVETLRPRVQFAILVFFVLWSAVGITHIAGRHGLAKATMNDHPEQVVAFIRQTTGPGCAVVVTYDTGLAFSLAEAHLPRLLILSIWPIPGSGNATSLSAADCARTNLYAVHSYLGDTRAGARALIDQVQSSTQFIAGQLRIDSFSFDPDARLKRRLARIPGLGSDLAPAAQLPDYRYVVTSGTINPAALEALQKRMPDFIAGDQPLTP